MGVTGTAGTVGTAGIWGLQVLQVLQGLCGHAGYRCGRYYKDTGVTGSTGTRGTWEFQELQVLLQVPLVTTGTMWVLCITGIKETWEAGSRKVASRPSSARSRLVILEPLQSKIYVFFGAAKLLQKPGVCFRTKLLKLGAWRT